MSIIRLLLWQSFPSHAEERTVMKYILTTAVKRTNVELEEANALKWLRLRTK
jgi:hypothetical protein